MIRKMCFLSLVLGLTALGLPKLWAYGEGPSDSGRWVEGTVTYADGSKCRKCCSIRVETNNGFSKEGCTNGDAEYKIYVASDYVRAMYFRGDRVWKGSSKTRGGVRINLPAS